jgi:predicted metal-dependent hydrolase
MRNTTRSSISWRIGRKSLPERETLTFDGLPVTLTRSRRRRTVSLRLTRGGLTVQAPAAVSTDRIVSLLEGKREWIRRRTMRPQPAAALWLQEGAPLYLEGRPYTLHLAAAPRGTLTVAGATAVLAGPSEAAMRNAYRRWAEKRLRERIAGFAAQLPDDVGPYTLSFRFYKSRWGCCVPRRRTITLNLWCAALPDDALRYVFCHEVSHLAVASHQADFYARLQQLWPEYRTGLRAVKSFIIE